MHSTLTPAAIRDCGYAFRPCTVHAMSDVAHFEYVAGYMGRKTRIGSRVNLTFRDGSRWSTSDWTGADVDVDRDVVNFLYRSVPASAITPGVHPFPDSWR